jgi:cytochrome b561
MSNAFDKPVLFFGTVMPLITDKNHVAGDIFHKIHIYCGYVLVLLICAHIIFITYRVAIKKHNILQRMI